jgi:peroxiredoxin
MSNDLTGDYDVVAEFSVAAIHRLLAGMHRGERLAHSLSLRVNDTPESGKTARSIVDVFGKATSDPVSVARAVSLATASPSRLTATDIVFQNVDPIVNARTGTAIAPNFGHLKGIAQLQLGPPTMELPADSGPSATFHTPVRVRYFPDPDAMSLPDFLRGEILTTFSVKQVTSQAGAFITVNLVGPGGNIHFNQLFPQTRLSASQLTAINKALRNAVITSFQPSNSPLPANVLNMQFKTMPDTDTVAVLMSLVGGNLAGFLLAGVAPDPDSVTSVFIGDDDQFAIAVAGDFFLRPLTEATNSLSVFGTRTGENTTTLTGPLGIGSYTVHTFATVTVDDAAFELQEVGAGAPGSGVLAAANNLATVAAAHGSGQILLTIPVRAHFANDSSFVPSPPDANFTISQAFTLSLNGAGVGLQRLGDTVVANVDPAIGNQIRNLFNNAWNVANAQIQQQINTALSADNLQCFLKKLMNPPQKPGRAAPEEVDPQLTYTSFEITRSGVILRGALAIIPDWPAPRIEFDLNEWTASAAHPEYNALNSWLPGGTIEDFSWSFDGNTMPPDKNTFVSSNAPPLSAAFSVVPKSVCLAFEGFRISSWGPVVDEHVVATQVCKRTSMANLAVSHAATGVNRGNKQFLPDVVLTQRSADGKLAVIAHASPWATDSAAAGGTANFIIHFPDDKTAANLEFLPRALELSGRGNTATAIICVLTPNQLIRAKPAAGLMFADDKVAWERLLRVRNRPTTLVMGTSGDVVWNQKGEITSTELAKALKKFLVSGGTLTPRFLELSVRVGDPAPNFLFSYAPGEETTLRKLAGRAVVLVFWKSTSKPSLETVANLRKAFMPLGTQAPILLAINDGDPDSNKKFAAGNGLLVIVDREQQISRAYGVSIWPTVLFLDKLGVVKDIRFGLITEEQTKASVTPPPIMIDVSAKKTQKSVTKPPHKTGRTSKD